MSAAERLSIEVAYALPQQQLIVKLEVAAGTTAGGAIAQSGLLQRFPQIDLTQHRIGIFSRLAQLDDVLRAGDRVEIYRPLSADPKVARRERVAAVRKAKQR
jgi:putative ubiquitin-RnfH superfamily antitoxin RatB of RatAB toxin-antitoxin module